jgi:hypothetical protein
MRPGLWNQTINYLKDVLARADSITVVTERYLKRRNEKNMFKKEGSN